MDLVLTDHGKRRFLERYTGADPEGTFRNARVARSTVLKVIRDRCPGHEEETKRNGKFLYWYNKDKDAGLWRVFVTEVVEAGLYRLITYFEIDYRSALE